LSNIDTKTGKLFFAVLTSRKKIPGGDEVCCDVHSNEEDAKEECLAK
jgi:hypothetical protein